MLRLGTGLLGVCMAVCRAVHVQKAQHLQVSWLESGLTRVAEGWGIKARTGASVSRMCDLEAVDEGTYAACDMQAACDTLPGWDAAGDHRWRSSLQISGSDTRDSMCQES
eukprot:jgi/Ulvmu1/12593/UM092_0023.1